MFIRKRTFENLRDDYKVLNRETNIIAEEKKVLEVELEDLKEEVAELKATLRRETRNELPQWVYELVKELAEQRDVHPELLFKSGAFEGTRKYDWCPCKALEKVPANIQKQVKQTHE